MIYLNPDDKVPLNNRALNYGDGFYSTMSVRNGRIGLFDRHCLRLDEHATRLLMDFDVSQFMLVAREQARNIGNGVLKVLV